jgi:hypothetical protein
MRTSIRTTSGTKGARELHRLLPVARGAATSMTSRGGAARQKPARTSACRRASRTRTGVIAAGRRGADAHPAARPPSSRRADPAAPLAHAAHPLPLRRAADAGGVAGPSSATSTTTADSSTSTRTVARVASAWRRTLVRASWTMRVHGPADGRGHGAAALPDPELDADAGGADAVGELAEGAHPWVGRTGAGASSSRRTPSVALRSASASPDTRLISVSAPDAASARPPARSRCPATPAWTLIATIACATTSWTSRAMRRRSSPTRRSASSSRVRSARSSRSCRAAR